MKLGEFVPPILTALRAPRHKQYASYALALRECTDRAYEDDDLVRVILEKTKRYQAGIPHVSATSAYSLCALLAVQTGDLSVLDFGGACGAHYFVARKIVPKSQRLKWIVVETPEMVRRASVLASDELSFTCDLENVGKVDLLHTSGTLQCVDEPLSWLNKLLSLSAPHILFNRIGLSRGDHDVITVHESLLSDNGPGPMPEGILDRKVRYPFTFMRESVFFGTLKERYEIAMTFDDTSGMFAVGNEPIVGMGLLARLKE